MDNYQKQLDAIYFALCDPTRRAIVERLVEGPASVSELAEPLAMSLPPFLKHLRALERAGLVSTRKHGRIRRCVLGAEGLAAGATWLGVQRAQAAAAR